MERSWIAYIFFLGITTSNCVALVQTTDSRKFQSATEVPQIPVPSGTFGIGRIGFDWVDTSRADPYSSSRRAHRELMVYLWYPTSLKSEGAKGSYIPGAQQMDTTPEAQGRMRQEFGDRWSAIVSDAIFSHAVEGAPAANSPRQFPVIIFSQGLGSTSFNYTCLMEDLVSRGYVVASIEHNILPWLFGSLTDGSP